MTMYSTPFSSSAAQCAWLRLAASQGLLLQEMPVDLTDAVGSLVNHVIHAYSVGTEAGLAGDPVDPAAPGHPRLQDLVEALDALDRGKTDSASDRVVAAAEAISVAVSLLPDDPSCESEHHDLTAIMKSLASKAAA